MCKWTVSLVAGLFSAVKGEDFFYYVARVVQARHFVLPLIMNLYGFFEVNFTVSPIW